MGPLQCHLAAPVAQAQGGRFDRRILGDGGGGKHARENSDKGNQTRNWPGHARSPAVLNYGADETATAYPIRSCQFMYGRSVSGTLIEPRGARNMRLRKRLGKSMTGEKLKSC